jgi:hypothetical protein
MRELDAFKTDELIKELKERGLDIHPMGLSFKYTEKPEDDKNL